MYTESFSVRLAFLNTVSEMKTQLRLDSQATSRLDAIASQITSEIPITETLDDLVNELTKPLVSVFQNVSTIPAQYRLTNKPVFRINRYQQLHHLSWAIFSRILMHLYPAILFSTHQHYVKQSQSRCWKCMKKVLFKF